MASVLLSKPSTGPKAKTHISTGILPPFIDAKQPPTKRSPWRQIRETPFISRVTVTLPSDLYSTITPHLTQFSSSLTTSMSAPTQTKPQLNTFSRLTLPLHTILTGDFYTNYIRKGNILLLSEGTPGISSWHCTLRDGTLRLDLTREVYERCGLQGTPADRNGGARKHGRDRWVVEMDLRAPAMVRGKKGFERLIRAVDEGGPLGDAKTWLFKDLGMGDATGGEEEKNEEEIVARFHPIVTPIEPRIQEVKSVLVPKVVRTSDGLATMATASLPLQLRDEYHELVEWLDMVQLASPRVLSGDNSDPYISRYSVPDSDSATAEDLTVLTWTGLLDQRWCTQLLIDVIRQSRRCATDQWLSLTVNAHRTEALGQIDGFMVFLQSKMEESDDAGDAGEEDMMDMDQQPAHQKNSSDGNEESSTLTGGFHRYICFQFVDSVTI